MKKMIYILSLFLFLSSFCGNVYAKKKKDDKNVSKKENVSPYAKLFKGKQVTTVDGLMKMHIVGEKLYAEFPLRLLNKDFALTSSIEDISDNGEGVVGQFAGRMNQFRFTMLDSMLQSRFVLRAKVENTGMGMNADDVIDNSNLPGVFQSYPIQAYTPDSLAVVVDMTEFFLESSRFTNPFSAYAGNSLFGFVQRIHKYQPERSGLLRAKGYEDNVIITCNMGFDVDRLVFGSFMQAQDVPVSVTVNKILMLLPEDEMQPRLANSHIGINASSRRELAGGNEGMKSYYITKRWKLEPVDAAKFSRGELVDVKKPIVFYIDTLMPATWVPYVKAGFEEWNSAFEKIGFQNVVQVKPFPRDPSFDANNIKNSTIRYAPLWLYYPQYSMHCDPRTGEILNASAYMHANMASVFYTTRAEETMAVDPSVRKAHLSGEQIGEMIKAKAMQIAGRSLGLTENYAASSAYPVDSLRSASFTREYGLAPSVMDDFNCNRIAQPGDVEKGVVLVQQHLGVYDHEVIRYLYQPIAGIQDFKDEKATLEQWIKEMQAKPYCLYARTPDNWAKFDPRIARGDLGDDHVKAAKYMLPNLKIAIQNFFEWYKEDDVNMEARRLCYLELANEFLSTIRPAASCIGGMELYDVQGNDGMPSYKVVSKKKQQEALNYLLGLCKDVSWLNNLEVVHKMKIADRPSDKIAEGIFNEIMSRLRYVAIAAQKSGGEYTQEEFIHDIYNTVWKNTLEGRALTSYDIDMEQLFLASIIATSCVDAPEGVFSPNFEQGFRALNPAEMDLIHGMQRDLKATGSDSPTREDVSGYAPIPYFEATNGTTAHIYLDMLLKTRDLIQQAVVKSSGETKLHYELMLYRIKKALDKK